MGSFPLTPTLFYHGCNEFGKGIKVLPIATGSFLGVSLGKALPWPKLGTGETQ